MTAGAMMRGDEAHSPREGFFNNYAATGQEEDKAETWSHMVRNPDFITDDPYVHKKIQYLRRVMRDRFPTLDDLFWERVNTLRAK